MLILTVATLSILRWSHKKPAVLCRLLRISLFTTDIACKSMDTIGLACDTVELTPDEMPAGEAVDGIVPLGGIPFEHMCARCTCIHGTLACDAMRTFWRIMEHDAEAFDVRTAACSAKQDNML